ncbi:hypothetical protein [Pseudonocardia sp. GCM10023141]
MNGATAPGAVDGTVLATVVTALAVAVPVVGFALVRAVEPGRGGQSPARQ